MICTICFTAIAIVWIIANGSRSCDECEARRERLEDAEMDRQLKARDEKEN